MERWKVYPLARMANPPAMKFINGSANIPINNFSSLIPYDTQNRSILQTDQRDTALSSDSGTVKTNAEAR